MAGIIYQGSTPVVRLSPSGIDVTDTSLGSPSVAIYQDGTFLSYEGNAVTVDGTTNTVSIKMSEDETLKLNDGSPALVQLIFSNETTGDVVRFPVCEVGVVQTIQGPTLIDDVTPQTEPSQQEEGSDPESDGEIISIDGDEEDDYEFDDWEDYDDSEADEADDLEEEIFDIEDVDPWEPEEEEES